MPDDMILWKPKELELEGLLEKNLHWLSDEGSLEKFSLNYLGRQVQFGSFGRVDLLASWEKNDKSQRGLVIIELKIHALTEADVTQGARYAGWARDHKLDLLQKYPGLEFIKPWVILIGSGYDDKAHSLAKSLNAGSQNSIEVELLTYMAVKHTPSNSGRVFFRFEDRFGYD